MKTLPIAEVYAFIVAECRHGCTNARSAFEYIGRTRPEWVDTDSAVRGYVLGAFLESLNFAAIREQSDTLYRAIHG